MFYSFIRILAYIVMMPLFFIRRINKKNLRIEGGSVLISHHISNWDVMVLGFSVKHTPVCFLAKEELIKNKIGHFFLKLLQVIPIARGKSDLAAIKTAIRAVKDGKMVGIFPEGTRSKDGKILKFNEGAALVALRGDVPVIPVYINGDYRPFHQVKVIVGEPIYLKNVIGDKINSKTLTEATDYLEKTIIDMSIAAQNEA